MVWTATVSHSQVKAEDPGVAQIAVVFSDGVRTYEVGKDVRSETELAAWILSQVAQYQAIEAFLVTYAKGTVIDTTPPQEPPPPDDPNAGLAVMTVEGFLGLMSSNSIGQLREQMAGAVDPLRRDVINQNRPAVMHWIALAAAGANPVITPDEAVSLVGYVQQKA